MIGTPNIMAKVSRSRRNCCSSLRIIATSRAHMSILQCVVARLSHQVDEHVLEGRLGLVPREARIVTKRLDRTLDRLAIRAADMQRRAECRCGGDARRIA